ncbi:DUF4397 domain-containing protein [Rubrolithibacter danxiaensis]|uniref:DUF4397 domain-containing protein n=1 Tax=Rubrolithibacter danxiaensis TaxID=3390805 RepID=UPI003BF7FAD7
MKTSQLVKRRVCVFVALLSLTTVLSSCLKSKNDVPEPDIAAFSIVNSYPGNDAIDFYIDKRRVNLQPLLYTQSTGYFALYVGKRSVDITPSATTSKILHSSTPTFAKNKYYTLFIARKMSTNADSLLSIFTTDSIPAQPSADKARIRFANLSPDAPTLDILLKDGTPVITGKAFKTVSDYVEVDPTKSDSIRIRATGTTTDKLKIAVPSKAGSSITIATNGLWSGTAGKDKFGAQAIINVQKQ